MKLKNYLLIMFALGCLPTLGQNHFGQVKCDSFALVKDSSLALVYSGQKTGLYNRNTDVFLVPFKKQTLVYLPSAHACVGVRSKTLKIYPLKENSTIEFPHVSAQRKLLIYATAQGDQFVEHDGMTYQINQKRLSNELTLSVLPDGQHVKNKDFFWSNLSPYYQSAWGVERLSDSTVLITDYQADFPAEDRLPYLGEDGDDSLRINPETDDLEIVYPPIERGDEHSGLLNWRSKKWLIPPHYFIGYVNSNGFLIGNISRKADDIEGYLSSYSFVSPAGDWLFQQITADELKANVGWLKLVLEVDSVITDGPNGWYSHSQFKEVRMPMVMRNGNYAVCKLDEGIHLSSFLPFLHYNPSYEFAFWQANDSLYLSVMDEMYGVQIQNSSLTLRFEAGPKYGYEVLMVQGKDSTELNKGDFHAYGHEPAFQAQINQQEIIIVEKEFYDQWSYNPLENSEETINFEIENASVWQKEQGLWQRKTPLYASVNKVPFGYLVASGFFMHENDFEGRTVYNRKYLLLDEEFKAINLLDYFDFDYAQAFDYGVKVCTEEACLWVDSTGKAQTALVWHDFVPEGDQLKAIRYRNFEMDKYYKFSSDNDEMIDTVVYFPLHKN